PEWEGLFAMGGFAHKSHRFAYQNEHQSPVSRPGFGVFSLLNQPMARFYLSEGWPDSRLFPPFSGYIRALSAI
ncbi:hypothetical protein, partial [Aeromonas veronii]|uniref:hypothetical protein n=1 Tax=Aeromonas veronii TaxID=654 RepID=UPI001F315BC6